MLPDLLGYFLSLFLFFFVPVSSVTSTDVHGPITEILFLVGVFLAMVFAHQGGEYRREQGKDESLHQPHKDLQ